MRRWKKMTRTSLLQLWSLNWIHLLTAPRHSASSQAANPARTRTTFRRVMKAMTSRSHFPVCMYYAFPYPQKRDTYDAYTTHNPKSTHQYLYIAQRIRTSLELMPTTFESIQVNVLKTSANQKNSRNSKVPSNKLALRLTQN